MDRNTFNQGDQLSKDLFDLICQQPERIQMIWGITWEQVKRLRYIADSKGCEVEHLLNFVEGHYNHEECRQYEV